MSQSCGNKRPIKYNCYYLPGSLSAKQPTLSPFVKGTRNCCFCASVAYDFSGPKYRLFMKIEYVYLNKTGFLEMLCELINTP